MSIDNVSKNMHTKLLLQNLIDAIPIPISVHDNNKIIIAANQAFRDFLRCSDEKLVGKTCSTVLHDNRLPKNCRLASGSDKVYGDSGISVCDNHATVNKLILKGEEYYLHIIKNTAPSAELTKQVIGAVETERKVLAAEIHDDLLQTGFSAMTHCNSAFQKTNSKEAKQRLELAIKCLDNMLSTGRKIIKDLSPPFLETVGLVPAILEYAKNLFEGHPIIFESTVYSNMAKLPPELETTLFRVTQEALINIVKHSNASRAKFSMVDNDDGFIEVYIDDNGKGLPEDFNKNSADNIGMKLMKERVEMHNGLFCVSSGIDKGTKICAIFPTDEARVLPSQEFCCEAQ